MAVYNKNPLSREDVAALFLTPVEQESLVFQTATVLRTEGYELRIPTVLADPSVGFYNEGQEIAPSDPTLGELVVVPRKVAGLTILSSEAAADSSPAAAEVVGAGLARSVAAKIDEAFFGPGLAAPAPSGLGALTGFAAVSAGSTAGGSVYANTDPFAEAISKAQEVGATLDSFVTSPATALRLAKIKSGSGSNEPLFGKDATEAGQRRILGVALRVSPSVPADVVWAYDSSRVYVVLREEAEITADGSVFYTSDRVAVRGIARVGFALPHPASVVKIAPVA